MSETSTETTVETTETTETTEPKYTPPATQADLDRIIAERVKRTKAQFQDYPDLKRKAEQFDVLQAAQQTAEQKAQQQAEEAQQRAVEAMQKAARTTVKTALVGVVDDPESVVDDLNIAKFLTDDGEIDEDAVTALRDRYAALGGGKPRTPAPNPAQGQGGKSTPDPRAEFAALWQSQTR
jgi:type II secretory pathway pseudopilin PulG